MACDRKTYNPNNMRRGIGFHSGSSFFVFNSNRSLALRRHKCIKRQETIIKLENLKHCGLMTDWGVYIAGFTALR